MAAKFQISPSTIIGLLTSITLTQIAGLVSLMMSMVWSGDTLVLFCSYLKEMFSFLILSLWYLMQASDDCFLRDIFIYHLSITSKQNGLHFIY